MTESEFFCRLRRALPECIVCPQVAIRAWMEAQGIGRQRQSAQESIAGKRALRGVFDQSMTLLSLFALNRGSIPVGASKACDQCLEVAVIRALRFNMRKLPSEAAIHAEVFDRNAAAVPRAGQAVGPAKIELLRLGSAGNEAINSPD